MDPLYRISEAELEIQSGDQTEGFQNELPRMLTDSEISSLLAVIGITPMRSMRILSASPLSDYRYATILEINGPDEIDRRLKIIIDISFTAPTLEQFLDVTYHSGAECNLKVIVFKELFDHKILANSFALIGKLVRINNICSTPTYFIRAEPFLDSDEGSTPGLKLITGPEGVHADASRPLPTKRRIEEVGFWSSYCEGPPGEKVLDNVFEKDDRISYRPVGGDLSCFTKRNEEGLCFELHAETNDQEIGWLWEHKRKDIERQYPGSTLKLTHGDNGLRSFFICGNNTPFSVCLHSTEEEKCEYAETLQEGEMDFVDLIEYYLEGYDSEQTVVHSPVITGFILWDPKVFLGLLIGLQEYLRRRLPKCGGVNICLCRDGEYDNRWRMTKRFLEMKGFDPSRVFELLEEYEVMDFPCEGEFANEFDPDEFREMLGLNESGEIHA